MEIGITKFGKTPSFNGHSLVTNPNGKKEYKFYLPTSDKNVDLEVVLLDKNGNAKNISDQAKASHTTIPVWSLPVEKTNGETVAYRFKKDNNYIYDTTIKVSDNKYNEYNEAIKSSRAALEMPKQMYHLMPDSFAPEGGKIQKDANTNIEIQRNHVNKFGGNISDVIAKIPEIKATGARKIISTPIYGNDTISNHGYWTQNPYQLTSTFGNINNFKALQVELLKNGMGWVADGAFANEGLNGIHMQDIMRWGSSSPYIDWFDTKEFNSYGFKFGVLPPEHSEAEKYYDIKIINSPVVYAYDENGKPVNNFGKKNPNYDPSKATYIQQFDTRLMDKNYINTDEALNTYARKQTNNIYDIKSYQDSVQLLKFQVRPELVAEKVSEMSKIKVGNAPATHSAYRDMLREWDNFTINTVDNDATIRNWTGKKDIVALNYKNPEVQNFIINTVKYWTNETDKILTTHIAKQLSNSTDKAEVLNNLAKVNGTELSSEELKNILNGQYDVNYAPAKENIKDELKDFPLLAAELPAEVQSLLSDKNILASKDFESAYSTLSIVAKDAFKAVHPEAFDGENLTKEGSQIFRLVSSDIMRFASAYALSGEAPKVEENDGIVNVVLPENFNDKVLHHINYESKTREEAAYKLEKSFKEGIKALANDEEAKKSISEIINNSTKNVNIAEVKMAKAIISKLELGLDHRIDASKDIMDLSLISQNKADAKKVWDVVQNFWKDFVAAVREYNPKSYVIGEVTCLHEIFANSGDVEKEFIKQTEFTTQTNYSHLFNIYNQLVHGGPEIWQETHENVKGLDAKIKEFSTSGYADNIRYSHEGVDNHDKPRAAHGFAIDINNFFNRENQNVDKVKQMPEFATVAKVYRATVGNIDDNALIDALQKSIGNEASKYKEVDYSLYAEKKIMDVLFARENGLDEYYQFTEALNKVSKELRNLENTNVVKNALLESVDKANLDLSEAQIAKIKDSIVAFSKGNIQDTGNASAAVVAEHFKVRPYNYVIEDAVRMADLGLDEAATEKVCAAIHNEMMKPAFSKYEALLSIMVAAPGNPTIFAGDEFGETGFETSSNNAYQHNRNQIHRGWAVDENRPEFKKFHDRFVKIFNMRNKACFKPLVDGDMVLLNGINTKYGANDNVSGIYRYDKNSDVITVINTNGFSNRRNACNVEQVFVNEIPVNTNFSIDNAYGSNEFMHVDEDGKEINDGFYRMENNRLVKYEDSSFTRIASAGIALTTAATYFVRKFKPSFNSACKQVLCSIK